MNILITGGCGFLGSNLAEYGMNNGHRITVFDNLSRVGAERNRDWLNGKGDYVFIYGDIRNKNDVDRTISSGKFDAVFHLAGQVTMTQSISDPIRDFETNTIGTINVLESVRKYCPQAAVFYSSTNKVYGDLEKYSYSESETRYICDEYPRGFDESIPLNFRSPYGCSKGSSDQYMLDYARVFDIKTVVFRHSSMYGSRQFATFDQGWVGWFIKKALEKKNTPNTEPFTISGNGKQVRDLLHANDMINLYYRALESVDKIYGNAFNIGGTIEQSLSLLELFELLNDELGIRLEYRILPPRESDQKVFVADITKINKAIGWKPNVDAVDGIEMMLDWSRTIGAYE